MEDQQAWRAQVDQISGDLRKLQQAQVKYTRDVRSAIDTLEQTIDALQQACQRSDDQAARTELQRLNTQKITADVNGAHKTYHTHISKFLKQLEKAESANQTALTLAKASAKPEGPLLQLIVKHLCYHGYRDAALELANEGNLSVPEAYLAHAADVQIITLAFETKDISAAERWLEGCADQLDADTARRLRFELAKIRFLSLVESQDPAMHLQAVQLAQQVLSQYRPSFTREIKKLMGTLLFAGNLQTSPYADFLSTEHSRRVSRLFLEAACRLRQLPEVSLLEMAVDAGMIAAPTFRKISTLLRTSSKSLDSLEELPIEITLPKRFRRHSVFSCPVSREQPSETNLPVLLVCGHVILRSSMDSIVKRANRFKCPTCYAEMTPNDVMPLHI